jgi:hypothetical protein
VITRAALALLGLAACGAPPPADRPTPPPPVDAAVDAPPPDPATAALLAALAEQRDRACACRDPACADDAAALAVQWGLDHPDVVRAATPTPAEQAEADALLEAAERCLGTGSTHADH